ncbi:hypothetical protein LguiA_004463 [Lonicera macranthoides]
MLPVVVEAVEMPPSLPLPSATAPHTGRRREHVPQHLSYIAAARDMANQVVKVRRAEIASCMKCSLTDKLRRDATNISKCMSAYKIGMGEKE